MSASWLPSALIVIAAGAASGQQRAPSIASRSANDSTRSAAQCDSLVRARRVDTIHTTVRAYLLRTDEDVLPPPYTDLLLQEFVQHLTPPRPLALPVYSAPPSIPRSLSRVGAPDTAIREPILRGVYGFRLLRDGRAEKARTVLASLSPDFDAAVLRAITVMSSERSFPPLLADVSGNRIPLEVHVTSGSAVPDNAVAVFTSAFPRVFLTDAVAPKTFPTPEYPDDEESDGVEGDVLFEVVIGPDGVPDMSTAELMHATTRGFADASLRVLPRVRFSPALVGACPVAQLVRVPFRFTLPQNNRSSLRGSSS